MPRRVPRLQVFGLAVPGGQLGAGVVNLRLHRLRLGHGAACGTADSSSAIGSTEMATMVTMASSRFASMKSTWPRK